MNCPYRVYFCVSPTIQQSSAPKLRQTIAVLAWGAVQSDLTSIPLSYKERGFDSCSPSLVGKGLGVRFVLLGLTHSLRENKTLRLLPCVAMTEIRSPCVSPNCIQVQPAIDAEAMGDWFEKDVRFDY